MGNKEQSLRKDTGYRVTAVKMGSPLVGQLHPFFDFILDITTEQSPRQVLDRLTGEEPKIENRSLAVRLKEQEGKKVVLKVFSAKDRTMNEIEFTPNSTWNDSGDLAGISYRLENYSNAQDNFMKVTKMKDKSPVALAGIQEGEYIIGIEDFKYQSISDLTDKMYEKLYDANQTDKMVRFVVYNVLRDQTRTVVIELKRRPSGQGLLGCQLSQGHLYRFPQDLQKYRDKIQQNEKKRAEIEAARQQLLHSDGTGKALLDSLKKKAQPIRRKIIVKTPSRLPQLRQMLSQGDRPLSEQDGNLEQRVAALEKKLQWIQDVILMEQPSAQ